MSHVALSDRFHGAISPPSRESCLPNCDALASLHAAWRAPIRYCAASRRIFPQVRCVRCLYTRQFRSVCIASTRREPVRTVPPAAALRPREFRCAACAHATAKRISVHTSSLLCDVTRSWRCRTIAQSPAQQQSAAPFSSRITGTITTFLARSVAQSSSLLDHSSIGPQASADLFCDFFCHVLLCQCI